ncbi:hypothetical protein [Maribacter sp. 2210JD10-5]|uniref:hypothetical protein n=1 Tax=Maribacter sp. 2210JD10-5 TaxID=3386272 RepID=UPI0039BC9FBA
MNKFFNYAVYMSLLMAVLSFTSCQEEFEQIDTGGEAEAIMAGSTTAKLVENTASKDGSFDNIVDGASCLAINFPYTVEVNGLEITVDTEEDLDLIEKAFDAIDGDEDILEIIFPITITAGDFTEITINGIDDLRELAAECKEGGEDDDIECLDFVYPMTLFTFNVNLEETGNVLVESDKDLRRFFAGLEDSDLVGFQFPITLKLYDGSKVTVDSNEELARTINNTKDACDEDDDNDYNDDDFDPARFENYLAECPWLVREFKRNDQERTAEYEDYLFNFMEDGTVNVKDREGLNINGVWEASVGEDGAVIEMEFETLVDFTLEWKVYEVGENKIKLFNGESNRIIMKRNCEGEIEPECSEAFIAEKLSMGKWIPASEGQAFLDGLVIDFSNRNIHVYDASGEIVDEGNWSISGATLTFNSLSMELANYIGDWEVVECSVERFKLKRGEEYLILEKQDEETNPDTLREILKECEWIIKKVKNQGEEIDRLLGYEFKFMAEGVVTLGNGINTSEGTWEIVLNAEQKLVMAINIGDEPGVSFEWPIRDLSNDRLKFEIEDTDYELILQRVCNDNMDDGDVPEIRNVMMGGEWTIASYVEGDVDMTADYGGYSLQFMADHQISLLEGGEAFGEGLWRVLRSSDEKLKVYLNFGDQMPFDELTDDWDFVSIESNRIELKDIDDNGMVTVLVFEKP